MEFGQEWDSRDTALLVTALAAVYADINTSKEARKKGFVESNPLLPERPSDADFDKAGVVASVLGSGVASILPPKWRRRGLGAWAGLEAAYARNNARNAASGKSPHLLEGLLTSPLGLAALGYGLGALVDDAGIGVDVKQEKDKKGHSKPALSLLLERKF